MTVGLRTRRLLRGLVKPRFDPARVEGVRRRFDEEQGFRAYADHCRAACSRVSRAATAPIRDRGFEYLEVLSPAGAADLLAGVTATGSPTRVKKDRAGLEGFRIDDPEQVEELLSLALPPAVDEQILAFFESEYLVHWFTLTCTEPAPRQSSVSFRWHCDRGPESHLKLLLYLNPTEDHGGNTALLDRAQTERVARAGYLFGPTRKRTDDLGWLSRRVGGELRERHRPLRAGEGLLFQPARVLHRGVAPDRGARFVLTLCLLPSPVPWREALRRGVRADLARDEKWPPHASEILRALGRAPEGRGAAPDPR